MAKLTERNARIQVSVDNTPLNGALFASLSGGDVTVASELVYSGNMDDGEQVMGAPSFSDVTVTCPVTDANITWIGPLIGAAQGGTASAVSGTPLDTDKNPIAGAQTTYVGKIKGYTPPPMDASSSTGAKHTIMFAIDTVTQG